MRPRTNEAILEGYVRDGKLRVIPSKRSKKLVVFAWLSERFAPERRYSEKDVNEILGRLHEDYATLRRDLCDYGFMQRRDGEYWRIDRVKA